jgi:hypothetical protein
MLLLAQMIDPGSAVISSWFGTSLLGGVLYWLLFHYLPAKDRQMAEILLAERTASAEERAVHAESRKESRAEFLQALRDQQQTFSTSQDGTIMAIQGVTTQLEHMEAARRAESVEVWKYLDHLGTRLDRLAEGVPRRRQQQQHKPDGVET